MKIAVLPGDGIGPEIVAQAAKVLEVFRREGLPLELEYAPIGGAGYDASGDPLPDATLKLAQQSDAVLLGAVGGYQYDALPRLLRPEQGLLRIRKGLNLFANLRPAQLYPELANASPLRPEIVSGLDIMILRELTGDIYFGQPRGIRTLDNGERQGFDTMIYSESEISRVAHVGFQIAMKRAGENGKGKVCSFDVILTGNIFGDILSDEASMLTGSIGMLPSASLDAKNKGLYEPCHGSAPDIAGKNIANPLATILSLAMMMRYTFARADIAQRIESAVRKTLQRGLRTADIAEAGMEKIGTDAMGDAVVAALLN
ncbi:MAG: 3-isopropylmalate dehydrogenase [Proteobacteria bacterium]|nr:3-isopropylmalate dehydrogenase [Pseudomonadota bacterium]